MKTVSIINIIAGISLLIIGISHTVKNYWDIAIIDFIMASTHIIISYICYFAYLIKKDINRIEETIDKIRNN